MSKRLVMAAAFLAAAGPLAGWPAAGGRLGPPAARGEARAKESERPEDQAAIRKRAGEFLKAAAAGDAKELAAFWTPSGEYTHDQLTVRGRDNIEKAWAEHIKNRKPGTVEVHGGSVRFLADDTGIQDGTFVVKRPNPAEGARSGFSALWVRTNGQWHLGLLREWSEEPSLQEFAWLIGTWVSRPEGQEVRTVYEWTENKTFIRSRFTLKHEDRVVTGFQVMALDPATRSVKSWRFDADGGLGESVWARTDKGWTAKTTGVTADGEKVVATTMLTPHDANSFTWRSVERTVDGEKVPDVGPIKVVREPGEK